ncbi:hypothetical protein ZIOFF_044643 [Zingiber officinale]|uniref:Sedoheptulose-1,7-bisphosphatase, chloroplastic n=1 Tax=Zingiber officinale TaxID=94328 RepID=A0A8J5FZG6_ZINOF|nr:hypothetical protein ZIOFF_044643 [Zingiber officinale]
MANSSQPPAIAPTLALAAVSPSFRLQSPSLNSIRLRRVFDLFDRNGDGEITVAELRLALERLGLAVDHEELASTVAAYVRPGRASLDFEDFEAFHRAVGDALVGGDGGVEEAEQVESDMREAFGVFDQNGDGFISAAELQAVLQKLGLFEGRSIDGVHRMISAVDRDFDGRADVASLRRGRPQAVAARSHTPLGTMSILPHHRSLILSPPSLSLLVSQPNTLDIPLTHIARRSSSLPQPQQPTPNGGNMCSSRGDFSCRLLPIALSGAVLCPFPSALPQTPREFLLNDHLSDRSTLFAIRSVVFLLQGLKSNSFLGEPVRLTAPTRPASRAPSRGGGGSSLAAKCEIGDSLEEFLTKATPDKNLIRLLTSMGEALRTISFKVRTASCGGTACVNSFGDEQLAVDLLANNLLFEASSRFFRCFFSFFAPHIRAGGFSVAFDPLDGSSIVDTNFTVGTIFGVWPGDKLTGVTGRDQVAAAMGIYGPRTTYIVALKDCPGTHEFLLLDEGKWQHVKDTTTIGEGKIFSPGNLRATFDNPAYDKLINYYVREKYTLRYTGGMVPDVNQIIVKEKGIFTNVTSQSSKAKLRLLFEVAPLGFLVEKAGGYSSDGTRSVLDKVIENLDERTQVAYGSKNEIIRFEETLYGSSRLKTGEPVGIAA